MHVKRNISNHDILISYIDFIKKTSKKLLPKNTLSNDVASDVYLKLYKYPTAKLMDMIYKGKLEAFIYITIRNHVEDLRRASKRRMNAEYDSLEYGNEIDYTDELQNKLNLLNEEEIKFISIFVTVKTQAEMRDKLNLSGRYIEEMKKQINEKIK